MDLLISKRGVALIMGETDSGKSSLVRYLAERIIAAGLTVSLVDSDIGQSSLGLPGCICMKGFRDDKDFERSRFERTSFLGTANPAKVIPLIIETSGRMVDLSRKTSDITIVDTTGLVHGRLGRVLKGGKIKRIRPDHIIAICRGHELEHILGSLEGSNIFRIRKAADVRPRSRAARGRYRHGRLQDYFVHVELFRHVVSEKDVGFFYLARPFRPESHLPQGTIAGLNRFKDTIGLGIVLLHHPESVTLASPIKSVKRINRLMLGDITIHPAEMKRWADKQSAHSLSLLTHIPLCDKS